MSHGCLSAPPRADPRPRRAPGDAHPRQRQSTIRRGLVLEVGSIHSIEGRERDQVASIGPKGGLRLVGENVRATRRAVGVQAMVGQGLVEMTVSDDFEGDPPGEEHQQELSPMTALPDPAVLSSMERAH